MLVIEGLLRSLNFINKRKLTHRKPENDLFVDLDLKGCIILAQVWLNLEFVTIFSLIYDILFFLVKKLKKRTEEEILNFQLFLKIKLSFFSNRPLSRPTRPFSSVCWKKKTVGFEFTFKHRATLESPR